MEVATHIIGKQNIRLRYHGNRDPFALRQMITNVCSDELPVRLNRLLDQYDDKDYVLRIDKLDINLSLTDDGNFQEQLAKAIVEKVEAALRQKLEQRIDEPVTKAERFTQTLRFYLSRGYLPRYSGLKNAAEIRNELELQLQSGSLPQIISELVPALQSPYARQRLLGLINWPRVEAFAFASQVWQPFTWEAWQQAFDVLRSTGGKQVTQYRVEGLIAQAILEAISKQPAAHHASSVLAIALVHLFQQGGVELPQGRIGTLPKQLKPVFQDAVETTIRTREQDPSIQLKILAAEKQTIEQTSRTKPDASVPDEGQAIFIGNAGLVLVALYLPAFFRNLNIVDEAGSITDLPKAVSMLRYLVFEEQPVEEMELVLEKLLCGIPLEQSLEWKRNVSKEEKAQADELLKSVIEHWSALKNTSPAGLRNSFLQREGKLTFKSNQWQLTVHKQAHDILLDFLPWNISMIKLPWMKHLMIVKWS